MTLLTTLLTALLALLLAALLLRWLCLAGWWLLMRVLDPLLERARVGVHAERVWKLHEVQQERARLHRIAKAAQQQRLESRRRFVTPSGDTVLLDSFEQLSLARTCRDELHLPSEADWPAVKKAWRRQVLIYHPDRGGDPQVWLRKLRAYEALRQLLQA